ncbi:MAG: two-component system response regulator [Gammaproteobacteria bacterium RIFOXYA12_FULL_61_12]|nr:MAG: two-component system response regulator [Gammaproteobacteria bacterium RIFOXYD12_FULL_61_37]OGT94109.1 MAG: two-component system response regulator [Gammaproteobacteria bacterium RIFOXYA12_FULL_61_12]
MNPGAPCWLVVDDDVSYNHVLSRALARRGFAVHSAHTPDEALVFARLQAPDYVVLDLNLAGESGLDLIKPLLEQCPRANILVLTGYASIPTTVGAIKLGAKQYLTKPASVDGVIKALMDEAEDISQPDTAGSLMSVQRLEWEYIQRVLTDHGGNISTAASALKMHRRTLQRKLAKRPPAN